MRRSHEIRVLNSLREIPLEDMVENLLVPLQEVREDLDDRAGENKSESAGIDEVGRN